MKVCSSPLYCKYLQICIQNATETIVLGRRIRRIQARRPAVQQKALVFGGEIMCEVTAFPKKCSAQELLYEVAAKEKNTESRNQKRSADSVFYFTERVKFVCLV